MCKDRTDAVQQKTAGHSINLVGQQLHGNRYFNAEGLGGLHVVA
jgi:hypothetical protein